MRRRILAVTIAVVLAVAGTAGVLLYVRQANARAVDGVQAVNVLVAQSRIPSGTTAASAQGAGLLRSEKLPAKSVPANAVRSITPAMANLVTSADVQPGQVLLRPMLVVASQATGGLAIPKGMVAITITLCVPAAVAGNVHPGSQVLVFDTVSASSGKGGALSEGNACGGSHSQGDIHARTGVIVPKAEVLSIGTAAAGSQPSTAASPQASAPPLSQNGTILVTLAVSQVNAAKLVNLSETGLPYLALLK